MSLEHQQLHGELAAFPRRKLVTEADAAALALLGAVVVRTLGQQRVVARIVETEAYDEADPASHSYRGVTKRCAPMFGPAGTSYVYRSYGIHWCWNVVVGAVGEGAAVLVRAVAILDGIAVVRARRPGIPNRDLVRGPGRLTAGLALDNTHNGTDSIVGSAGLCLNVDSWAPIRPDIKRGPRVGISKAESVPRRFWIGSAPETSQYRASSRIAKPPRG